MVKLAHANLLGNLILEYRMHISLRYKHAHKARFKPVFIKFSPSDLLWHLKEQLLDKMIFKNIFQIN